MDLNQLPFQLRFNSCYKLSNEIDYHLNKLDQIVQDNLTEIQDKTKIIHLLENNFNHISNTLRLVSNYLKSSHSEVDKIDRSLDFIQSFDEKIQKNSEDQKEYSYLKRLKQTEISLDKLPECWQCLTWEDEESIKTAKIKSQNLINDVNFYEKKSTEKQQLCDINHLLNLFDYKIKLLKQKSYLLDESIFFLFDKSKEYLEILLRFKIELSKLENLNEQSMNIQTEILKSFNIDDHIDFRSESSDAFPLLNSDIKFKLKK